MNKVLIELTTKENGEKTIETARHLPDKFATTWVLCDDVPFQEPSKYHIGKYVWNNQLDCLDVIYEEGNTQEKLEDMIVELQSKLDQLISSDKDLGSQITEIDLSLLEHKTFDHEGLR